jgi:hypothetical protein
MTFSNHSTQIVHSWLEAHDCTRQFWQKRAQHWADDVPPEEARKNLAEEFETALRRSITDDVGGGLWGKLAAWAIGEVSWNELAARWLASAGRGSIWNRLSHGAGCPPKSS